MVKSSMDFGAEVQETFISKDSLEKSLKQILSESLDEYLGFREGQPGVLPSVIPSGNPEVIFNSL